MFDLEAEIERWRSELERSGIHSAEVLDELESHLREEFHRLSSSDLPGAEKFQMAVSRLGDFEKLQREFFKAQSHRFWGYGSNPAGLKILAFWFVLIGLSSLYCLWRLVRLTPALPRPVAAGVWITLFVVMLWGSAPLPIGIGLLNRHRFSRVAARVWIMAFGVLFLYELIICWYHPEILFQYAIPSVTETTATGTSWVFLGIALPLAVMRIVGLVNLFVLLWGLRYLGNPPVRKLFRRAS